MSGVLCFCKTTLREALILARRNYILIFVNSRSHVVSASQHRPPRAGGAALVGQGRGFFSCEFSTFWLGVGEYNLGHGGGVVDCA